jgi:DNA-binding CsgD family transcriptional regulator
MDQRHRPTPIQLSVDLAVGLVRQDRWMLAARRGDRLRVLADSSPEEARPFHRLRCLSHLARRCLGERRPLTVSAIAEPDATGEHGEDWERDWPALVYAPVGVPGRVPVGLLILGSRRWHWYGQNEVDYAAALGVALTSTVLWLGGPLARLRSHERAAVRLLGAGRTEGEIAAVLNIRDGRAEELTRGILRKLRLRSAGELAELWSDVAAGLTLPTGGSPHISHGETPRQREMGETEADAPRRLGWVISGPGTFERQARAAPAVAERGGDGDHQRMAHPAHHPAQGPRQPHVLLAESGQLGGPGEDVRLARRQGAPQ